MADFTDAQRVSIEAGLDQKGRGVVEMDAEAIRALIDAHDAWKRCVQDTVEDMECLPGCDSIAHEDACPVAYPANAWRMLRERAEEAEAALTQSSSHIASLEVDCDELRAKLAAMEQLAGDRGDALEDLEEQRTRVLADECPTDEVHCACVPYLRSELDAYRAARGEG